MNWRPRRVAEVCGIRNPATTFAKLPPGTANPEGITVGPDGDVYVANFDVAGSAGHVVVFDGNTGGCCGY